MSDQLPHKTQALIMAHFNDARARVHAFSRRHYGLRGAWSGHRMALGWDIFKAPINLVLAIVALIAKFAAWVLRIVGRKGSANRLAQRPFLLATRHSRYVERLIADELLDLDTLERQLGEIGVVAQSNKSTLAEYQAARGSIGEIATTTGTAGVGLVAFNQATPGVISLVPLLSAFLAQSWAIVQFPLGAWLGQYWYAIFPARPDPILWVISIALVVVSSAIFTTFAGLITDPSQHYLGLHQRRLRKVINSVEAEFLNRNLRYRAREPLLARVNDLVDGAAALWRSVF